MGISDYHRFHFPMSGTIKEIRVIPGVNPSGGEIWWDAQNKRYGFDPSSIGCRWWKPGAV
ncbi:phosphatidylserine decarboxylase [Echinicola jeungdonensis]|nr:phosphatidylserine decarboxylase [Echinicola jeungdonensis]MDN3671379.1 phosphatidylserine decarboxylase [Echinicola jeungdonensis]